MSTSYFMNIGAYVATVIFATARLAVGGVLTEPGAPVPALLVLGILLIPLASKGGFQKSTYQTGPAFGLAWGVLYALTPAQLSSDRISGVLEASLEGLSFSFKDNLAVFCIGLLLLVGLSAVRKYFPNAALNVLRYAILTLMQLLAFEGMFRYLLDAQSQQALVDKAQTLPSIDGVQLPASLADASALMAQATGAFQWNVAKTSDSEITTLVNDAFSRLIAGKLSADDFVAEMQGK